MTRKCRTTHVTEAVIWKCHEVLKGMGLAATKRQYGLYDQIG